MTPLFLPSPHTLTLPCTSHHCRPRRAFKNTSRFCVNSPAMKYMHLKSCSQQEGPHRDTHGAVVKDTVTSASEEIVGAAAGVHNHLQYVLVLKIGTHTHRRRKSLWSSLSPSLCLAFSLYFSPCLCLCLSVSGAI